MYIKVRKLGAPIEEGDLIVNISKMAMIQELRNMIYKEIEIEAEKQLLLYKGKQLIDDHRVMDYDVQLNDVIQLIIRNASPSSDKDKTKSETAKDIDNCKPAFVEAESKYYKAGDLIDVQHDTNGAWIEAVIEKIVRKSESDSEDKSSEDHLIFKVKGDEAIPLSFFRCEAKFSEIRPRSYYTYKTSEILQDMIVLVNYNIEDPKTRGCWFDFKVVKVSSNKVEGTLLVGNERTPIENCNVKFTDEVMRIEEPKLLSERIDERRKKPPPRKYLLNCNKCRDVKTRKCRECGCRICGGKESCDTIILCDECDFGYHIACLDPPLTAVPDDDEWYCPDCKTDENEIVKAGDKLKFSNKKSKMASSKTDSKRDWGKGMACVGRTKECTIVPKDHMGPVPGVEVGTSWKFRLQVSEAGIHRPHVAGIHGRETDGAYSLVLSGGYEDDVDNGNEFFYTGSGGRDLSGNKRVNDQSCDQKLTRMNKALAINCNAKFDDKAGAEATDWKKGKPVRVVRNYKLGKHSKYAPKDGNRYDGIYKVVKYYPEKGKSGFIVWRYLLRRNDPAPAPWEKGGQELEMIYPPGYLEAQEAEMKKEKENKNKTPQPNKKGGSKRKAQGVQPLTDFFNAQRSKKTKTQEYKLESSIEDLIAMDNVNQKLWDECKEVVSEGKQTFLRKVEELFICICCQEVVYLPITTECKHNICKACLKRSFSSEIFSCPYCRFDLAKNSKLEVNDNLSNILKSLFPGYEAAR